MVKCPYCKETFIDKDIVVVRIQKEVLESYGMDELRVGAREGYDIYSCPKCRTFLGCQLLF
jgi:uncharacterized protein YbaR (Trm112 family)